LHDAQVIAEQTPAFVEAVNAGECPEISDSALNDSVATIIIRSGCGNDVSGYILGIYIDTKTGIVTKDNGTRSGLTIETPELAKLREKLFADRAAARITRPEAMCLLLASSVPGAEKTCAAPTVVNEGDDRFIAALNCRGTQRQLAVDRFSGKITDLKENGAAYSSPGGDQLRADITASHSVPRLTPEDAKRLAMLYTETLGPTRGRCMDLRLDPQYTADEAWFVVSDGCGDSPKLAVISVDMTTGTLRLVGPNTSPDSAQLRALREKLLDEARVRTSSAAARVQMACRE
jgi:hypothetical protein